MPELPEVETIKRGLRASLLNKKIQSIEITSKAITRNAKSDFTKSLVGNAFSDIGRVGKLLIFYLKENDDILLIHLKMTGQLIYRKNNSLISGGHNLPKVDQLPNAFTRVTINFFDQSKLFFNDMRRFGYLSLIKRNDLSKVTEKYGPEPLSNAFTIEVLKTIIKNRSTATKMVLMNQELIAGIGNIYADEILYEARIKPTRPANSLSDREIKKLFTSIKLILEKAIEQKGTTFRDYADSEGSKGKFSNFLKVYGKAGKNCSKCSGKIEKIKLGGRGTFFCPSCQK